jgi:hypothetical protein
LASASLSHSPASLVYAAFGIATVACYLFLAALLSSPGPINSFVIKAVSMLVAVISLCDEKRGHGRIAKYDELNKLFWYPEVTALLTLCSQIRLNSSIFHQQSISCVSTASTGIAHSSRWPSEHLLVKLNCTESRLTIWFSGITVITGVIQWSGISRCPSHDMTLSEAKAPELGPVFASKAWRPGRRYEIGDMIFCSGFI